jgi:hypothetical protein
MIHEQVVYYVFSFIYECWKIVQVLVSFGTESVAAFIYE